MMSLMYADAGTYSGVDEDDALDMDHEIVFMARFLGEEHNNLNNPEGVVEGIMEDLEVTDPVFDSSLGFMTFSSLMDLRISLLAVPFLSISLTSLQPT